MPGNRSARERVVQLLQLAASEEDRSVTFTRPLKDIAGDIGLTHEAFYRTLANSKLPAKSHATDGQSPFWTKPDLHKMTAAALQLICQRSFFIPDPDGMRCEFYVTREPGFAFVEEAEPALRPYLV